ncbi:cysteine desulfurase [Candidatus Kaiserbacteria bacterium]|nr:cysteine desulfurase [Candidatus Kaiserbacteria bacterium]
MFWNKQQKRVYLDWAAATPLLPEAKAAMTTFLSSDFGNPSAIHAEGVRARQAVDQARELAAKSLQVRPEYITFTSGGTEANNLAMLGMVEALRHTGREYQDMQVITTKIEHPSVLRTVERLASLGVIVDYVSVDEVGKIILTDLQELLSEKTILVSCSYANSEIGVIQPLHNIKKTLRAAEERFKSDICWHVDAAQAPMWLNCQFDSIGADLLTLDTAKCCGPKGVGLLVCSHRAKLAPVVYGGQQEAGLRSGTENVTGITGAATALQWSQAGRKKRVEMTAKVRDVGIEYLLRKIPTAILNGPLGDERLANNINISIPGLDTEFATIVLDKNGFAVSTKSACSGAGGGESVVVFEISSDHTRALSTLRLSIGPTTTTSELKKLVDVLQSHIEKMQNV